MTSLSNKGELLAIYSHPNQFPNFFLLNLYIFIINKVPTSASAYDAIELKLKHFFENHYIDDLT